MPAPILHGDFETRSVCDLKLSGLWNYARHPTTDPICFSYAFKDEEPSLWLPGQPCPPEIVDHLMAGGEFIAHNAAFELDIWNEILVKRYGWPRLLPAQTYCTMAMAYAMGLPGGLEDAALALGLAVLKDTEGRNLMLRVARPRRMEGTTPIWWDDPDKLARVYAYCQQDVRVERELHRRLLPLSAHERRIQLLDWRINERGVAVDRTTAHAGAAMSEEIKVRAGRQLAVITGGIVTSPDALIPLRQWCEQRLGFPVPSLAKDMLAAILSRDDIPQDVRAALVLRQEAGKASVAKLNKILELAGDDERLHNSVQYHAAFTGRWAARGVQVHNLVRDMPPAAVVEEILGHVRDGALDWINLAYGPPMECISRCSRSFFIAPDGKLLLTADFSAVEGRGTAWVAGEEWKLAAFRAVDAKTGPGIYEVTASKTLGIPVEEIGPDSIERQIGKVQELLLGYGGGVGALRRGLPPRLKDTPDKTLNKWKLAWRAAHPRIVAFWHDVELAAVSAVHEEGKIFTAGAGKRGVQFKKAGSFLWCRLPSGRVMCYPYPKLLPGEYGTQLTYMTVPGEADIPKIIKDVKNANNWARIATYGGALTENIVQAICRDLLAEAMLTLDAEGFCIVLHVHDEVVCEVQENVAGYERKIMEGIMRTPPVWAPDFPQWSSVKQMKRYGKG